MRLLIVSNRLPFTAIEKEGNIELKESVGGIASGLSTYLDYLKSTSIKQKYIWIGWPGISIDKDEIKEEIKSKFAQFNAYPIFISKYSMQKFYNGFCNKTIWPLFHYFTSHTEYENDFWLNYKHVNEVFCDTIMQIIKPDDILWIHDYHLMLLPKLIRKRCTNPIGFFLHIPFPSFEIFRLLPHRWQIEILEGTLGSNLIGFHTHEYTQYFLRCVLRTLGYEHNMGKIILENNIVQVDTLPMGINFQKYNKFDDKIYIEKEKVKKSLKDYKTILSIDRLDYTKGLLNRLLSYELFLEKNKQWRDKVILLLIVVPSRIGVENYQQMKKEIDELVGRINGRFGDIRWTPISYQFRFLSFEHLASLYKASDIALITPLRDGMNLIAKEYVASREDKKGVLILSELAGASKELGEAIIINPNDKEEIADAIKSALEMPEEEQVIRNQIMQERLSNYDIIRWADDFIKELVNVHEEQKRLDTRLLIKDHFDHFKSDFNKAKKRLIFLDYDGTLIPFSSDPKMGKPNERILKILKLMSESPKNEIILISGRDRKTLQSWFSNININLVAEHGIWIKEKSIDVSIDNTNWKMIKPLTNEWKPQILPILNLYKDRVPGTFIEEKEFSIVWHYRSADPEQSSIVAKELTDALVHFTANIDVQVIQGSRVVEVKNAGINKGTTALHWINKDFFDFILAIGDDLTDEDLFRILPKDAYSIRVGMAQSYARFNLHNYLEVLELLEAINQ